jgi:PAS domain S-box-containing protein
METGQVERLIIDATRLSGILRDVSEHFHRQQDVLRLREIHLDPNIFSHLQQINERFVRLLRVLEVQQPELANLRVLFRTMSMINSSLSLSQVLDDVMDTFIQLTGAERGLIGLINPENKRLDFKVVRGLDTDAMNKANFAVSRTVVEDVMLTGEPVLTTNALDDSRYSAQESIISYNVRSIICVPLKSTNNIIGVAYSDHRFRNEVFGDKEMQFLVGFANQAAVAIENARLYESVQQRLSQITEIRNFLGNVFSSIVSGVVTLDNEGRVISANRAAELILGFEAETSLNKHYSQALPVLFEGFETVLERVRAEGRQQLLEVAPILPRRGAVFLNLKFSPLIDAESQRRLGVAIVIDDLTESRQRDETLRVVNTYLSEEMVKNIQSIENLGLNGEERQISAVFADVRGFTSFSETLAPEILMQVINQYLSVSSEAIQSEQGIIDKFMGDAVLGLFNTQLNPSNDHALRCVRSAWLIVRNVERLHTQLPPDQRLKYGIGIHSGVATLGNVGSPIRKEFTAIGEAVDYAKKLQECAQGGEIVISPATYEQVKGYVEAQAVERPLRGADEPTLMYLVHALRY